MKLRHSIVTRFGLFFTGLIIFSILLSGYLVFTKASQVITEHSKERIMHASELAEQQFYALLNEVTNDIAVITLSPTLQKHIVQPSDDTAKDLDRLFSIILKNKESYFQIRLIDANTNGKEIIRFNKENGNIYKSDILQQKGDREYFKEALQIKKGEHYFSNINLNEEYGLVSDPPTPTLRVASAVFNQGQKVAILIINVSLSLLYETLDQIGGIDGHCFLIDHAGQYLYSPERSQQFGLQTKQYQNFYEDYSINKDTSPILKEGFTQLKKTPNDSYLCHVKELTFFDGKRKILLISTMEKKILLKNALAVKSKSLQSLLWVCLFSFLLSLLFTNLFSKKITKITKAISNYDQGIPDNTNLDTNRKDEIGVLANTFSKMKVKIDQNVKELNIALEKEYEARNQRDEFLQNMSHEMRTPLNAILGLTKLLYKNASKPQLPIINALERSSSNLAGLVYDVLDHQKLIEGKLQILLEPTNIAELLKDIHATYLYEAVQKGLTFTLSIDNKLESRLYHTDALRLTQIVTNLVINAIKYTKEGQIELQASINNTAPPLLEIRVKDTGVGVLPKNLNKINDRFFMEKNDLSGRYGSYGLGLSIVKQLTTLFGGTLRASSQKDAGSEFIVSLPLLPIPNSAATETPPPLAPSFPTFGQAYKVLHIEDDASTSELIKHLLNSSNVSLLQTNSLDEALAMINSHSPKLIISDLMLDNQKIHSTLQQWITTKIINCPLMIVSALEPLENHVLGNLYFQKPFDIGYFKDAVYKILGSNEFQCPDFQNIYSSYDHDPTKIVKVLKLLEEEFTTYSKRIDLVNNNKKQEQWEAILHKLIAHINNLSLTSLKDMLPEKVSDLENGDLDKIRNTISYYLCCFRVEQYLNSKDLSS